MLFDLEMNDRVDLPKAAVTGQNIVTGQRYPACRRVCRCDPSRCDAQVAT